MSARLLGTLMREDVQAAWRSRFRKDLTLGPQVAPISGAGVCLPKPPRITWSAVMTELEPEREEDEPEALRSAAVEALKSAARQSDPKESDRLTRHGLTLIERARAIGHRQNGTSEVDGTSMWNVSRMQEEKRPHRSRSSTARLITTLWRLCSWRPGR
jgi:hypothetical protein